MKPKSHSEPLPRPTCSAPSADDLLERAHDLLADGHIMLDGWPNAMEWHNDYERYKAQNPEVRHAGTKGTE